MAQIDQKGGYNRAPIFIGENYAYLKDCMYIHLMSIDIQYWLAIKGEPFFLKSSLMVYELENHHQR